MQESSNKLLFEYLENLKKEISKSNHKNKTIINKIIEDTKDVIHKDNWELNRILEKIESIEILYI